jgi:hypothetical protein
MHLCFVDESGTPSKPGQAGSRFFTFGGIIIPEERWHGIQLQFLGLKRQKGYHGEVKWRYFAPHNADAANPMLAWGKAQRNEFRAALFNIITATKSIRLVCGVCQVPLAYGLGNVNSQEDVYFRTYKVVTERFQYFLQDVTRTSGHQTNGIIVADHRNSPEDSRMREQHERLVRETDRYTSTYQNFVETIFLAPSHLSAGMQLADLVAGATHRYFSHGDDYWIEMLRPAFRSSPSGRIDGFGISRFPKAGWTGPVFG